ncbi:unnamed protein product [Gadus morhua 'NCC']
MRCSLQPDAHTAISKALCWELIHPLVMWTSVGRAVCCCCCCCRCRCSWAHRVARQRREEAIERRGYIQGESITALCMILPSPLSLYLFLSLCLPSLLLLW